MFKDRNTLYAHRNTQHLTCDIPGCRFNNTPFSKFLRLVSHEKRDHSGVSLDSRKQFGCSHCSKTFTEKFSLNTHIKAEHGVPDGAFKCSECPNAYATAEDLKTHMYRHNPLPCPVEDCNKKFKNKNEHSRYLRRAHPGLIGDIPCSVSGCPQTFTTQKGLSIHLTTWHNGLLDSSTGDVEGKGNMKLLSFLCLA